MNNVMYGEKLYPFDNPLTSRQRKTFVENLSLESLKYCFGETYSDLLILYIVSCSTLLEGERFWSAWADS